MRHFKMTKMFCSTMAYLFLFCGISNSQTYRFKNFSVENKLPGNVVYTLNQDNKSYLWVGTIQGLSKFDGFDFINIPFPDSVSGRYPTVSLKDKTGRLWFGCNDGTIYYADEGDLNQIEVSNSSSVSSLLEAHDGSIYTIHQRKPVFRINPEKPDHVSAITLEADPLMFSACVTGIGQILIGTQENILLCDAEKESLIIKDTVAGFDYARVMAILPLSGQNSFAIGTDGSGLYKLDLSGGKATLSRFPGYPVLETLTIKSLFGDSYNNIWISTPDAGVVKLVFSTLDLTLQSVRFIDRNSGLPGNNATLVFQDREDNYWIGFNGNGLSLLNSDALSFYAPGGDDDEKPNNVIYVSKLNGDYFLGTPSGFYLFDLPSGRAKSFTRLTGMTITNDINSYYIDNENNVWIGTKGSGLYLLRKSDGKLNRFYRSGDTGSDYINHIEVDNENIWLATLNGIKMISRRAGELKRNFDINNGLPHNSINQLYLANDGSVYLAAESERLYRIDADSGIFASDAVMNGMLLNKILAVTQSEDGTVWAATQGNGVFACLGDSLRSLSVSQGLLSNYAYSIFSDSGNEIWIGHERGFSRYDPGTGAIKTYTTDFARGGSCNADGFHESPDGIIVIGTTQGVIVYDRLKDKNQQIAPVNNINYISINDVVYRYQPTFSLPYKKRYNIKVGFTGIDFSNPEKVYYRTFLENYDEDWTELSLKREASYSLRDGKYKFSLISVNDDGLLQETPVSFEINIKPPVWRSWWFILSAIGIVMGIIFIIIREREKAHKKIQDYLEKELDARTEVVRKQKTEIELQNLEITDSINYARRIQSSILPDIHRLKQSFSDAFVLLYPRDIVSGDFYWFDKLDNDRFVLVCADSTGHGVPGAFMSMIGTTLLQDIVSRQRISKPSDILARLDKQIFSTLNQNLEEGVSNDGMDMVVCEFTQKNRHLRFASAMRPVILVMGGESYYIKGNRSSVGGESVVEKYFDDQEYYLGEGDIIYLFSDGLPDQFGGSEGKKMKVSRLKNLVCEVSSLSLEKQSETISKFYNDWKGNNDQVDDILFMAVKV